MNNERSRTLMMLVAFAVGSASLFFTNAPAELGYGMTIGCSIVGFVFASTIYVLARKRFLAKKANDFHPAR